MVFLGERKSILPGAEAATDKDLHSTAILPREGGQSRKKLIQTDGEVQAMYLLFREHHLHFAIGHEAGIRRTSGVVCLHPL